MTNAGTVQPRQTDKYGTRRSKKHDLSRASLGGGRPAAPNWRARLSFSTDTWSKMRSDPPPHLFLIPNFPCFLHIPEPLLLPSNAAQSVKRKLTTFGIRLSLLPDNYVMLCACVQAGTCQKENDQARFVISGTLLLKLWCSSADQSPSALICPCPACEGRSL